VLVAADPKDAVARRVLSILALVPLALALAAPAGASQLLIRNASGIKLAVNKKGEAMVTYRAEGRVWRVLAWGAVNARDPDPSVPQVQLKLDRSGGWKKYGHTTWQKFGNACSDYDGPELPFLVAACKAPDGSYWALQSWQRLYPNLGWLPWLPSQSAWELHISHWTGDIAKLEIYSDWVWSRRYHQLFGRLTYRGKPVYGFKSNNVGARQDRYGRLIYIDTYNSVYGSGWRRENSFLTHRNTGVWCYGFYKWDPFKGGYQHPADWPRGEMRGPGTGEQYRVTTEGPGVTPDISFVVPGLHDYNAANPADVAYERQMNGVLDQLMVGDNTSCRQH
jgi:hypothetical protein